MTCEVPPALPGLCEAMASDVLARLMMVASQLDDPAERYAVAFSGANAALAFVAGLARNLSPTMTDEALLESVLGAFRPFLALALDSRRPLAANDR